MNESDVRQSFANVCKAVESLNLNFATHAQLQSDLRSVQEALNELYDKRPEQDPKKASSEAVSKG